MNRSLDSRKFSTKIKHWYLWIFKAILLRYYLLSFFHLDLKWKPQNKNDSIWLKQLFFQILQEYTDKDFLSYLCNFGQTLKKFWRCSFLHICRLKLFHQGLNWNFITSKEFSSGIQSHFFRPKASLQTENADEYVKKFQPFRFWKILRVLIDWLDFINGGHLLKICTSAMKFEWFLCFDHCIKIFVVPKSQNVQQFLIYLDIRTRISRQPLARFRSIKVNIENFSVLEKNLTGKALFSIIASNSWWSKIHLSAINTELFRISVSPLFQRRDLIPPSKHQSTAFKTTKSFWMKKEWLGSLIEDTADVTTPKCWNTIDWGIIFNDFHLYK